METKLDFQVLTMQALIDTNNQKKVKIYSEFINMKSNKKKRYDDFTKTEFWYRWDQKNVYTYDVSET